MLEKEFAVRYRNAAQRQHAPASLVEETVEAAQHEQAAQAAKSEQFGQGGTTTQAAKDVRFAQVKEASRDKRAGQSKRTDQRLHVRKPRRSTRRWAMPVAACVAALAVLFGAGAAVMTANAPFAPQQARAYAKTPNLLTAELGDGVVPFALDDHTAFQGWGSTEEGGAFSGLQFTLEGSGISQVQATISHGELYRITTETYDRTTEEGVAILNEALHWKPLSVGTGKYLAEYDYVTVYFVEDGYDRLDPRHQTQLRLIKRIGSTVDLPYEEEPITLGLWFDDMEPSDETGYPDYASLDGTTLTLTVAYDDGTFRTQEMTLHDGWFICEPTSTENGADTVMAEGPLIDHPTAAWDRPSHDYTYTLYGEVTAITNQPHPYSLENANVRSENTPVDTMLEATLGPRGSNTLTAEAAPSDERICDKSEVLVFDTWGPPITDELLRQYEKRGTSPNDWVELQLSGFSAYACNSLEPDAHIQPPEGREVIAFGGNFEYLGRIRSWTSGWSMSEDGHPNEGNSLVMMDVDITNDCSESVTIGTHNLGTICTIDRAASTTTFSTASVFAAKDDSARLWDANNYNAITFQPHETVRLHLAFIVDDDIIDADEVYYALGVFDDVTQVSYFNEDPDSNTYVSLGKLERQ